jgi:HEAT repeat protein
MTFAKCTFRVLVAACVLGFCSLACAGDSKRTQPLIAVLRSEAGLFEKARACQQLGEFGTADAVPALEPLLGDEHLNAYARSGLEGIGSPSAAAALRAAAGQLHGRLLAGVVNSLGVLRDPQAVEILIKLSRQLDSGAANKALSALGRIANDAAVVALKSALLDGPEELRTGAAAGCLVAADRQLTIGKAAQSQALYDMLLSAKLPPGLRLAAVRGAILARQSGRVPFLVQQLRSPDVVVRNGALITIREIPSSQLATALNEELRHTQAELQHQLLTALADCHNDASLGLVEEKTTSDDPEIRKTALRVLAKIDDPAAAAFLLDAVVTGRSPEEISLGGAGLERIEGSAADELILKRLNSATNSDERVRLIRLVATRAMTNANSELMRQASCSDARVQIAALEALKSRSGTDELPRLIALTKSCQDVSVRLAAEAAVYGACTTMGDTGARAVLAELKQAGKSEDKNSWVRVLTSVGYADALPLIQSLQNDHDDTVALNAIEQLGQWPDPSPIEALFGVTEGSASPERRRQGLDSAIRLARAAADEHRVPDGTIIEWFERANKNSDSVAEKKLIISGLGRLSQPESLQLLTLYLDQPDVGPEAEVAVLQIAPALAKQGTGARLQVALEKIAATTKSAQVRDQARKIAEAGSTHNEVPLFDGSSLKGWEGDANVWRVREHVIVGGSMAGNPRNEFLASTRDYTNFVLRLEYKLVGTEGFINSGVQFHSVRVLQPSNEMCGYQADIGAGYSGCLYDESRRNKFLARPPEDQVKRLEQPGEWNRYEVRCDASRTQILLNGEKTVDYTEPDVAIPHTGRIGLQIHGGSKAEVSFRNISLVELP